MNLAIKPASGAREPKGCTAAIVTRYLASLSGWGLQAAAALRFVTLRFGEIPNILEYSRLNCDALS